MNLLFIFFSFKSYFAIKISLEEDLHNPLVLTPQETIKGFTASKHEYDYSKGYV